MVNGWKTTAIIFIFLFILETVCFGYLFYVGLEVIKKEAECSNVVCLDYDSFGFDIYTGMCYCYTNGEVAHLEVIE